MTFPQDRIRNFCIIAHIDHGKSTLADRLLEKTGTLTNKEMRAQVLDTMDLERERGITIKSHPIRMVYRARDGRDYLFNLIDTPGHVDFTYEVSRSLAACDGAILVVDAVQGIQAQTVSNVYLAVDHGLELLPVINKIDLPAARVDEVAEEIHELIGAEPEEIVRVSAREGTGVEDLLEAVVARVPAPVGDRDGKLQGLVFDSFYDTYRGSVIYVSIKQGRLRKGDLVRMWSNGKTFETMEVGYFRISMVPAPVLEAGEVGYVVTGIKDIHDTKVGDTITLDANPCEAQLPGYHDVKPMVFSGLYPVDAEDYEELRDALEKLRMNDASFIFEPETSTALGFGFRCGFLGLLHMEIIQERLEREYNLNLITTMPNVEYIVRQKNGEEIVVDNPAHFPAEGKIEHVREPYVKVEIVTPSDYVGAIMSLNQERRGVYLGMEYVTRGRAVLRYDMPLAEILIDYYDKLKSLSRGYASLDYDYIGHRESDVVRLDIAINGDPVDALSMIVHQENAYMMGRDLASKLKEVIPRQMYEVAIQACMGSKVISRTNVKALRKNVTAKCYGGDITRKRKLLEKQKEGKRRMKMVGKVEIPQEAFLAVLKVERTS
ncbi:MAG: translation elongation factor 4 [Candidatus Krumholzibacteria bacterium]|nr:translation elongation factor 4 [Candidatus Krumholzibacteria bacterium]MDH4337666.1 translation elongation factor 4 [Candidatus Krumholzibacteria bacterium]MDH5270254.1 translation elongation factor 4 [Candidatus Krumholzibacteria bacterium]MDH5628026.1 translation elongation factor 4 [Candidatus Krumholzibacteria bacterium]